MILLRRLNDKEIIVNSDLIESIISTPDTTLNLTTNRKIIVKEDVDVVIEKIIDYKKKIFSNTIN